MSDLFRATASIDYPIIDSDSHVNEPPELWQERLPAKLKERGPKVEHSEHGDLHDERGEHGEDGDLPGEHGEHGEHGERGERNGHWKHWCC